MELIKFDQCNVVMGANQPEYRPLYAHKAANMDGAVTSCWKLTLKERIKIFFTGRVYVQLLTFNYPIQPQLLSLDNQVAKESRRFLIKQFFSDLFRWYLGRPRHYKIV